MNAKAPWIADAIVVLVIVVVIALLCWGAWAFIGTLTKSAVDQRCGRLAWAVAQTAGIDAGKAADKACRHE